MPEQKLEIQQRIVTTRECVVQIVTDVPQSVINSTDPEAVHEWVEQNVPHAELERGSVVSVSREETTVELIGADRLDG